MAWDKQHIKAVEEKFSKVNELVDSVGCIFVVQSALAIWKHNSKGVPFPKHYLSDDSLKDYEELIENNKINNNERI